MRQYEAWTVPLLTAALLALTGWIYTTGNRVVALETRVPSLEDNVKEIRKDVREIREWLRPKGPPGSR